MKPLPPSIDVMEGFNVQMDCIVEGDVELVQYKGESMRSMQREFTRRGFEGRFQRMSQSDRTQPRGMSPMGGMAAGPIGGKASGAMMVGGMSPEGGMMAPGGMMVGGMSPEGGMMMGEPGGDGGMMGGMMGMPPRGPRMEAPEFVTKPQDVEVELGGTAEFNCEVTGKPAPEIMW